MRDVSVRPPSVVGFLSVLLLVGCETAAQRPDASIDAGEDDAEEVDGSGASPIDSDQADATPDDMAPDRDGGGEPDNGGGLDASVDGSDEIDAFSSDLSGETNPFASRELCQQVCAVTAAVPCSDRRSDCAPMCEALFAQGFCAAERRPLYECWVAATSSAFFCMTPPGVTMLKPGICTNETDAFRTCVKRDGGSPD